MFINFTNHPSERWSDEQKNCAGELYGRIVDLPFPGVPTDADTEAVQMMAEEQLSKIDALLAENGGSGDAEENAVLCQGEFTLAFVVVTRLLQKGVTVVSAVSERNVREIQVDGETRKEVVFRFAGFRKYHA